MDGNDLAAAAASEIGIALGVVLLIGVAIGWVVWIGIPWLWHHVAIHLV